MGDSVSQAPPPAVAPIALTVITVVKNNLAGLRKTHSCLASQSNQGFSWLVMDGLSTDGSVEWLQSLSMDANRFKFVSAKDKSLFNAMNKAIGMFNSRYCIFLNGGDYFYDDSVADKILRAIQGQPAGKPVHFAYGQYVIGGLPGFPTRTRGERIRHTWEIFYGRLPCHQSSIISRDAFQEIGGYREDLGIYGDREWMLRYSKRRKPSTFLYLPFVIAYYDPNGLSNHRFFRSGSDYFRIHWTNGNLLEFILGALGWLKTAVYISVSRALAWSGKRRAAEGNPES